jgi:hypothetical protein
MKVRLPLLFVIGSIVAVACTDQSPFRAQFPNEVTFGYAYAMNGTHPALPSAVSILRRDVLPIDATFQFDFAFDMDEFGFVTVHSVRRVANEFAGVNRVGFQLDSVNPFDQIARAPVAGYAYDTSMRLMPGNTLLVDVLEPNCQGRSFLGFNLRAKLKVDSVDNINRIVFFQMLPNVNCGFRSLLEGLPKE